MDWLRWWHGTVTDPKFQWVARKSDQGLGNVLAVWAAVLECASNATQCNADATRGNVASFDCNDFDVLLGLDDGCVQRIYDAMIEKKLIQEGRLSQWEARQPKREDSGNPSTGALSSTERSRLRREKQKRDATESNGKQRNAPACTARLDKSREEVNLSVPNGTGDKSPADPDPEKMTKDELWAAGKSILMEAGMPKAQCGTFVGKLVNDYEADIVVEAVRIAVVERPADPASFLKATCQRLKGERTDSGATRGPWFATDESILAKGAELGMHPLAGEAMITFKGRVQAAIDNGGKPVQQASGARITQLPMTHKGIKPEGLNLKALVRSTSGGDP
jgi:hypothetical protein